ncbi:MAG: HAD hydrolase-like protein [Patescibacteria group bacterium]|jgi:FMN phosphatase YigB (HAD superfamily)
MQQHSIIFFDFNRTLYDPDAKRLITGARSMLVHMKKRGFMLVLMSHGDARQEAIVRKLRIAPYFSRLIFVRRKSVRLFRQVTSAYKIMPRDCYVVGDRIRQEISIGNRIGMKTVWFRREKFSEETPRSQSEFPGKIIRTLSELERVL